MSRHLMIWQKHSHLYRDEFTDLEFKLFELVEKKLFTERMINCFACDDYFKKGINEHRNIALRYLHSVSRMREKDEHIQYLQQMRLVFVIITSELVIEYLTIGSSINEASKFVFFEMIEFKIICEQPFVGDYLSIYYLDEEVDVRYFEFITVMHKLQKRKSEQSEQFREVFAESFVLIKKSCNAIQELLVRQDDII